MGRLPRSRPKTRVEIRTCPRPPFVVHSLLDVHHQTVHGRWRRPPSSTYTRPSSRPDGQDSHRIQTPFVIVQDIFPSMPIERLPAFACYLESWLCITFMNAVLYDYHLFAYPFSSAVFVTTGLALHEKGLSAAHCFLDVSHQLFIC